MVVARSLEYQEKNKDGNLLKYSPCSRHCSSCFLFLTFLSYLITLLQRIGKVGILEERNSGYASS